MTEQAKQPQETERERYTVDQIKQQIAVGVVSEHVVVDMVAHYDAMQQNRDMYRTLAGIGAWHSDCRPNREMCAHELQKSQAVIDKLADEITEKNRAYDAMQQERDALKAGLEPFINGRVKHYAQRAEAAEATVARVRLLLLEIEQHCPCGARPESLHTHPHVGGCPVAAALTESTTPAPEAGR